MCEHHLKCHSEQKMYMWENRKRARRMTESGVTQAVAGWFVRFAGGETPPLRIQMKQYLKIAFPDKGRLGYVRTLFKCHSEQ